MRTIVIFQRQLSKRQPLSLGNQPIPIPHQLSVTSIQYRIDTFLRVHSDWWKQHKTFQAYGQLKQNFREFCDLVHIERHLQVSPIMPKASARKDTPRRPLYRTIFCNTQPFVWNPLMWQGVPLS